MARTILNSVTFEADIDIHLKTSTAETNQVLTWDGADYAWAAGGAGGLDGGFANSTYTVAQVVDGGNAVNG